MTLSIVNSSSARMLRLAGWVAVFCAALGLHSVKALALPAPLNIVKVTHQVRLADFDTLYIEPVGAQNVSFGKEAEKAQKTGAESESLEDAKKTLPEAKTALRDYLIAALRRKPIPAKLPDLPPARGAKAKPALSLEIEIADFDPGNRVARAFLGLFGGGKVRVGVKGQILHYQKQIPYIQFYHERYAAWTIAGELPKRLLLNATRDIAEDLAAYLAENWEHVGE